MSGSRPQFIHLTAISSRIHLYSCFIFISISNRLINLKLSTLFFISKVLVKDTLLKGIPNWGLHSLKSLTYFTALSTQVYHHLQQLPTYLSWIVLAGLLGNKIHFYLIRNVYFFFNPTKKCLKRFLDRSSSGGNQGKAANYNKLSLYIKKV